PWEILGLAVGQLFGKNKIIGSSTDCSCTVATPPNGSISPPASIPTISFSAKIKSRNPSIELIINGMQKRG
uniref:Uncharacterized protein n=1 Tax=Romanomermis culicivorax TaxID=13658 RepID=A0A915JSJ3_ROMCU